MFLNPTAHPVTLYTLAIDFEDGHHETYRNVAFVEAGLGRLSLDVLNHGISRVTLTAVRSYDRAEQQTLVIDE